MNTTPLASRPALLALTPSQKLHNAGAAHQPASTARHSISVPNAGPTTPSSMGYAEETNLALLTASTALMPAPASCAGKGTIVSLMPQESTALRFVPPAITYMLAANVLPASHNALLVWMGSGAPNAKPASYCSWANALLTATLDSISLSLTPLSDVKPVVPNAKHAPSNQTTVQSVGLQPRWLKMGHVFKKDSVYFPHFTLNPLDTACLVQPIAGYAITLRNVMSALRASLSLRTNYAEDNAPMAHSNRHRLKILALFSALPVHSLA